MKALVMAVLAVVLLAGPVMAAQCPLLHKQLDEAVAKMKADDPKVKQAAPMIKQSKDLHAAGKHAESVAKADEAAKALGVTLTKKK